MYVCVCMYCNVTTTFWQEIRARYATRFFHPLFTIDPNTTFILYIYIYIYKTIRKQYGISSPNVLISQLQRGKLNLNVCHNVRGRKWFTLPSRDIFLFFFRRNNLNRENFSPPIHTSIDRALVKIITRSMINFIYFSLRIFQ